MNWAIFTMDGLFFGLRWLHVIFGITWIGLLYYFNFVQGPFFAETDAPTKSGAIQKLVPRALWWFRWAAMFTLITGICMLGIMDSMYGHDFWKLANGVIILTGVALASLMWFNVWFVIWPNQKIIIQSTTDVAQGKGANPAAAACAARAGVASRSNVLLSIPMVFFMIAGKHLSVVVSPEKSLMGYVITMAIIIFGIELNALKGKTGPMTSVKGVIHCGFALAVVMYILLEVLTK